MTRIYGQVVRRLRIAGLTASLVALSGVAAPVAAQDLVHRFINPSFGGNPFYSDHLLATAAIDRPKEPTTPTVTPTDEELLAQQLRARLLSTLSGNILDEIQNAAVGASGNFDFGNQRVSYQRTSTGTTVTFTNTTSGEVNTVVIPTPGATGTTGTAAAQVASGERALSATAIPVLSTQSRSTMVASITAGTNNSAEQALLAGSTTGGSAPSILPPF